MIIEKMNNRKADYIECIDLSIDKQRMIFIIATRGLIGLRT
jgi:predicted membrane GTPase involved in stress response